MQPVAPKERIAVIDALRGVALLGIIVANMRGFNSPVEAYMKPDIMWNSTADLWTQALIDCFVTGKFITIFAILFGLGFAVQLTRAADRGEEFAVIFARRLGVLLLLGVLHVALFWWGDILFLYAATGFLLLLFYRRDQETVMLWSQILYWLPMAFFLGFAVLAVLGNAEMPEILEGSPESVANAVRVYKQGSFGEMMAQRFEDWREFNSSTPFFAPRLLGYFLFGLWLWRKGVFQAPERFAPIVRRLIGWFLLVGLAGNIVFTSIQHLWSANPTEPTIANLLMWTANSVGVPALSLFYGSLVVLLFLRPGGRRWLAPFTYVGRMALTNYILQSAVCTWIFYSYGLALFGEVAPLPGLALSVAIYALQVVLSALWLRRFRFGPLEWLWRSLTYLRPQPVRASAGVR